MGNRKGFQIIELLVVIGLASILIYFAVNIGFRAVKDASYTGAVNKLLAEISFCKNLAIRENRYVLMQFNDDGTSYTIRKQERISDPTSLNVLVRTESFFDKGDFSSAFYDGTKAANYSFVVNSMGMVYRQADIGGTNPMPSTITINVFFTNEDGSVGEKDTITINPSGGVNVKKTKKV